jgi:hypothetical protein
VKVRALIGCCFVVNDFLGIGTTLALEREKYECQACRHLIDCPVGKGMGCYVRKDDNKPVNRAPESSQAEIVKGIW